MNRGNDVKLSTLKSNGIFLFNYAWLNLCFKTPMCVRVCLGQKLVWLRCSGACICVQSLSFEPCASIQYIRIFVHQPTEWENFKVEILLSRYFLINSSPHRTLASALIWCFYILVFQKQSAKRHSAYLRLFFHPSVLFTAQSGQDLVFLCLQSFFRWNSTEIFAFNSLLSALSPFTKWTSLKATVAFNCLFSSGGK